MAMAFFPSSDLSQRLVTPINPNITNSSNLRSNLNTRNRSIRTNLAGGGVDNFFSAAEGNKPKSGTRRKTRVSQIRHTNSDESPKERSPEFPDEDEQYDVAVRAALSVLKFYKSEISPILPKSCRFVPSCSEYSMIAYRKYGWVKGSVLTAWRVCRCNPLNGDSGFDPPRWFDEKRPAKD